MTRKVFFSFEHDHDAFRSMVVRNSWVVPGIQVAKFIDKADFERIKLRGSQVIKRWIDNQLKGTSVTVVLVGGHTCNSDWVKYEIKKSLERGNGLLGINISKIPDSLGKKSKLCGRMIPKGYKFYRWKLDDGYKNMGKWIEAAARAAGR